MSFLNEILRRKREEVAQRRARIPASDLEMRTRAMRAPGSLFDALSPLGGPLRVIAEVKRASPSAGTIRAEVDAPALAARYAQAGAAAISVLTDGPGFGGSLADLEAVRAQVEEPLLRKDFIVDPYQLLEARAHGADAALLIVAALSPAQLAELRVAAESLGLDALIEIHGEGELETALKAGARIIGINNRDLASFKVDLAVSERILPRIPPEIRAVAESGVKSVEDVARLKRAGAANLLIGEALVRAPDPAELLARFQEAA